MSTLNGSWNFLSGLIIHFGAAPAKPQSRPQGHAKTAQKMARRMHQKRRPIRRLTKDERAELLDSIRHDDWFE